MGEARRWQRYKCQPRVKGNLYWAHKFFPRVAITITDISECGIGFLSEWKLEEGMCELKINSLPTLRVEIRHKSVMKEDGRVRYRYGMALRRKLHSVQLAQLTHAA